MGMIGNILGVLLGGGRNAIRETVEVFRPNAEAEAIREAGQLAAALTQFATEFTQAKRGWFDRFMDGLNRLPRPMLAIGTLALFVSAMADPVWFSARMQGIALVPEPLWWLMGAVVSFYFGARHQTKFQDFQKGVAETLARTPDVVANIQALEALGQDDGDAVHAHGDNAALDEWRRSHERR